MKIPANVLKNEFLLHSVEYEKKAIEVLRSGWYVLGREVIAFEEEFANYIGTKNCVGVGNGLDAIYLALRALGISKGDEVIVQANAYIACVIGITQTGATPVFVEPDEYFSIDASKIEEKITNKTKALLIVHLYGHSADMDRVLEVAKKYNLFLVEDCAQSHGTCFKNKKTGSFGDVGCFSFYPSKTIGGFGDGGAIVTNDDDIASKVKVLRNYGSEKRYYNEVVGVNSRLDEMQAGLLRIKLKYVNDSLMQRQKICESYLKEIENNAIILPKIREDTYVAWHQFVIRTNSRDAFADYLKNKEIDSIIHYPIPPHLSKAYEYLKIKQGSLPATENYANTMLSLPLYIGMTTEEQNYVINVVNQYKQGDV